VGISGAVKADDELAVDFDKGEVRNVSKGRTLKGTKLPAFILEILSDGGLIENLQKRMKKK
jgi:3-isopropylmalate/(R)-2-methylmalate dehydratase small subunit